MYNLISIFGTIIIFGVVSLSMYKIVKSAEKIHKKLNMLKESAKLANTKNELQVVLNDLKKVNDECFHKSFYSSVIEIKTIIETKYDMLNNLNMK